MSGICDAHAMNILILGATGATGAHLVDQALERAVRRRRATCHAQSRRAPATPVNSPSAAFFMQ